MSKKKALSFKQFIKRFPNEEACFLIRETLASIISTK